MSNDLSSILGQWEFKPDGVLVRVIDGDDGRKKIQLRLDLGILQMEMDGRPDGLRPEGFESWLDYFEHREAEREESRPDEDPLTLSEQDCLQLWREAVQYYHRYISFWHLERYELCARDTARNLRLFGFVRDHVSNDRHKLQFDQWRPYVLLMHSRAVATPFLQQRLYEDGLRAIEAGIDGIREFLDEYDQGRRADECTELVTLERWRDEIISKEQQAAARRPKTAIEILRQKLDAAVAAEEFEEAARLRDQIHELGGVDQERREEE
ncbi:MAG: UvrB/UvrC motif-containing protein [Thermoguttaceae bacterium]